MKIKKIIAAVAAAAVAASMAAVNTFALGTANYFGGNDDGNHTVYLLGDPNDHIVWCPDSGVAVTDVYGVRYNLSLGDEEWIGGAVGQNCDSVGWNQFGDWSNTGDKSIAIEDNAVTYISSKPIFEADEGYAQLWLQVWGGTATVTSVDILGADGVVLSTEDAGAAAPAGDGDTASKTTGNVPAAAMVSVMALAGVAAAASKKRK